MDNEIKTPILVDKDGRWEPNEVDYRKLLTEKFEELGFEVPEPLGENWDLQLQVSSYANILFYMKHRKDLEELISLKKMFEEWVLKKHNSDKHLEVK